MRNSFIYSFIQSLNVINIRFESKSKLILCRKGQPLKRIQLKKAFTDRKGTGIHKKECHK